MRFLQGSEKKDMEKATDAFTGCEGLKDLRRKRGHSWTWAGN